MESVQENASDGGSLPGINMINTWPDQQNNSSNNSSILYIAVEYVKENDYKLDTVATYAEYDQHVSPLDPNMSSVAPYSPVYTSGNDYENSVVVTRLVNNNQEEIPVELPAIENNMDKQAATNFLQVVNDNESSDKMILPNNDEEEVELLITDQSTGISYLVERCLEDDNQLLEQLSSETLLDTDLLSLDENSLKTQLPEIVVESGATNLQLASPTLAGATSGMNTFLTKLTESQCGSITTQPHLTTAQLPNIVNTINTISPIMTSAVTTNRTDVSQFLLAKLTNGKRSNLVDKLSTNRTRLFENEDNFLSCVQQICDKPILSRARATLPESHLIISKNNIGETGVYAKKFIPKRTQFGPIEGLLTCDNNDKNVDSENNSMRVHLSIETEDGNFQMLGTSDENHANWMCFVKLAPSSESQNLVLTQHDKMLFYTTIRNILPMQQLLVGYGTAYATRRNLEQLVPKLLDDESKFEMKPLVKLSTNQDSLQRQLIAEDKSVKSISEVGIKQIIPDVKLTSLSKQTSELPDTGISEINTRIQEDTAKHSDPTSDQNKLRSPERIVKNENINSGRDIDANQRFVTAENTVPIALFHQTNNELNDSQSESLSQNDIITKLVHSNDQLPAPFEESDENARITSAELARHRAFALFPLTDSLVQTENGCLAIGPSNDIHNKLEMNLGTEYQHVMLKQEHNERDDDGILSSDNEDSSTKNSRMDDSTVINLKCAQCFCVIIEPTYQRLVRHLETEHGIDGGTTGKEEIEDKFVIARSLVCCFCQKTFFENNEYARHVRVCMYGRNNKKSVSTKRDIAKKNFNRSKTKPSYPKLLKSGMSKQQIDSQNVTNKKQRQRIIRVKKAENLMKTNSNHNNNNAKSLTRNHCPVCFKLFANVERVQNHLSVHESEDKKPLPCDRCGKRFMNQSALTCHYKTHMNGRKVFECPMCDDGFHNVLQLKAHVQKHCSADGKFVCPHCSKICTKYSIVRKHIRAFHSERRHVCSDCAKSFCSLDKLRMHLLRHSDHKEFLCADCGKQFKRKDKLKEHIKKMHGEETENDAPKTAVPKPQTHQITSDVTRLAPKMQLADYHRFIYKCHTCLLGFKRRGMLVNHLAKRHPDIPPESVPELNLPILRDTKDYYCTYCDKVYKSSSKRKLHILKNHPGATLPLTNRLLRKPDDATLPIMQTQALTGNNENPDQSKDSTTTPIPVANLTFSQTVGSVAAKPQACNWCHKQYASKAKLVQHQRKKHPDELNRHTTELLTTKINLREKLNVKPTIYVNNQEELTGLPRVLGYEDVHNNSQKSSVSLENYSSQRTATLAALENMIKLRSNHKEDLSKETLKENIKSNTYAEHRDQPKMILKTIYVNSENILNKDGTIYTKNDTYVSEQQKESDVKHQNNSDRRTDLISGHKSVGLTESSLPDEKHQLTNAIMSMEADSSHRELKTSSHGLNSPFLDHTSAIDLAPEGNQMTDGQLQVVDDLIIGRQDPSVLNGGLNYYQLVEYNGRQYLIDSANLFQNQQQQQQTSQQEHQQTSVLNNHSHASQTYNISQTHNINTNTPTPEQLSHNITASITDSSKNMTTTDGVDLIPNYIERRIIGNSANAAFDTSALESGNSSDSTSSRLYKMLAETGSVNHITANMIQPH